MAAANNTARGEDAHSGKGTGDNSRPDNDDMVRQVQFSGKKTKKSEMITLEINLTDPADLMRKLEMVDLTDEETDDLLQQALELNKLLKSELKRQNLAHQGGLGARQSTFIQLSAPASAPSSNQRKSGSGVHIHQKKPLPPLRKSAASTKSSASHSGFARPANRGTSRGSERSSTGSTYSYHSASPQQGVYGVKSPVQSASKKTTHGNSATKKEQVVWRKVSASGKKQ